MAKTGLGSHKIEVIVALVCASVARYSLVWCPDCSYENPKCKSRGGGGGGGASHTRTAIKPGDIGHTKRCSSIVCSSHSY